MNIIDIREGIEGSADNFSAMLIRLVMKADYRNRQTLKLAYPTAVMAVEIYQTDCPYVDGDRSQVDWNEIESILVRSGYLV